jgi:hypothetical protein
MTDSRESTLFLEGGFRKFLDKKHRPAVSRRA